MKTVLSVLADKMTVATKVLQDEDGCDHAEFTSGEPFPESFYSIFKARPLMVAKEVHAVADAGGSMDIANISVEPLSMPFSSIWIERTDGEAMHILTSAEDAEVMRVSHGFGIQELFISRSICTYIFHSLTNTSGSLLDGASFIALSQETVSFKNGVFKGSGEARVAFRFAKNLFELMKKAHSGTIKTGGKYKIKEHGSKLFVKVPDITFISLDQKPYRRSSSSESFLEVDWSHRWEVMGHWRRHEGLGKDRFGERVIDGWTWVKPHVKGPEDRPLKLQTRVFTGSEAEMYH